MTNAEIDEWSLGVINGLCRVLSEGDPATGRRDYPPLMAPLIAFALKRIEHRALPCSAETIKFAKSWLREVETGPKRTRSLVTNCHHAPRKGHKRNVRRNRQKA